MLKRQGIEPIYENKWFSGTQCSIYIGDVLIDEALSIEYSVSQSKTPIYGYASQLFDKVAPGPVLVQGSLTVNYIEAGYLYVVLDRYKRLENFIIDTSKKQEQLRSSPEGQDSGVDVFKSITDEASALGISVRDLIRGNVTAEQRHNFIAALAETATKDASQFQKEMDILQQQIWGEDISTNLDSIVRRADDNYFDDVELFVVHGNTADPSAPSTARRISGVHFLSCSQQVTPDGSPTLETYSFLGRNLH